jgi:two-component system chemotaxis sensor kinase CheA
MTKDPYRFFRIESRELLAGLEQNIIALEKSEDGHDEIERILRFAHTLKGASRVVKLPDIAEYARALEDLFEPIAEKSGRISAEIVNQSLQILDAISAKLAALEPAGASSGIAARRPQEDVLETVRVEVEEMDALLRSIAEASTSIPAVRKATDTVEKIRRLSGTLNNQLVRWSPGAHDKREVAELRSLADEIRVLVGSHERSLATGIAQLETQIAQIYDAANRVRLHPIETIFAFLERAVRDAGESLQKKVEFASFGGDIRIDGQVLIALRSALLHIVRNAVAHGIETASEREGAGKPAIGRVELRVERREGWVVFTCRDDGQGINVEAVRRVAIQKGLLTPTESVSFSHDDATQLMLQGRVTTSASVDDVSGRGIGLDVVRATVERFKGKVKITSSPGQGAAVEVCVPMSLSSVRSLQVEAGGLIVSIPLDGVRRTMRVSDPDIARSAECDSVVCDEQTIPFLPLISLLEKNPVAGPRRKFWSVIVLESSSGVAALAVDHFLGANSVIVKQLPAASQADPIVAGVSMDAEGNPQLVLDPESIVKVAYSRKKGIAAASVPTRLPILVIDDSLTTRMLEQSILESAGYVVHLAASAEEGLEKARERPYGLFLVDVEMPGMNGFEFVSQVQSDSLLREIPAVLVTSRNTDADRRLGQQVGASAYIVKGEFDQEHLLQLIANLVG